MLTVFEPVEPGEVEPNPFTAVAPVLTFVNQPGRSVYVEWPEGEPWVNVIAVMQQAEHATAGRFRVAFDPDDEHMWEILVGGYRLHGMFISDLIGEESEWA